MQHAYNQLSGVVALQRLNDVPGCDGVVQSVLGQVPLPEDSECWQVVGRQAKEVEDAA